MNHSRWHTKRIGDVSINLIDGDRSAKYPKRDEFQDEGILFLNTTNIVDDRLDLTSANFISEEKYSTISKGRIHPLDIIMTTRGSVGKVALYNRQDKGLINAQMLILRADGESIDPRFLFHLVRSEEFQCKLKNFASGSAQPQIPITDLKAVTICYPDIGVQREIASILSAYDDLIENNSRRIRILEEMAQTIYREWFVNFRSSGYGKVSLVPSEIGPIPNGWSALKIRDVLQYDIGGGWGAEKIDETYTVPAYMIRGTDIPAARMGNLKSCPLRFHKESNVNPRRLQVGDIVFEVSGGSKGQPVGRALLVHSRILSVFAGDAICASFCKLLRPDPAKISSVHFFQYLLDSYTNGLIEKYQVQSTGITNFKFGVFLEDAKIVVPPGQVRLDFERLSSPLLDSIALLGRKNAILSQTRDLLLPRLISGEISVEHFEVETAGQIS